MNPLQVVLVHWEQPARCAATVEAFLAQTVPVRITVVDNASSPEAGVALKELAARHGAVELVTLDRNAGFGPAANAGLRRWLETGVGEWAAVAPHDAVPATDCLERLLAAARPRPGAGLACADVGDGHVPVLDPYFGGMTVPRRRDAANGGDWVEAGYPHGTLMFLGRACLNDVGLFDERYFAYGEEADLGWRAGRAGWDVGLVTGARVTNSYLGGRVAVVDYLMLRNTLLLVRHWSGRYKAGVRFVIGAWHLVKGLAAPSTRPPIFDPAARLRALVDFARGRFGPPPAALTPGPARRPRWRPRRAAP